MHPASRLSAVLATSMLLGPALGCTSRPARPAATGDRPTISSSPSAGAATALSPPSNERTGSRASGQGASASAGGAGTAAATSGSSTADVVRMVTVPAGAVLWVTLETDLASDRARIEDPVRARVTRPVRIGQAVVIPEDSELVGTVTAVAPAGRVQGRARLSLQFHTVRLAGGSGSYALRTRPVTREARSTRERDAARIAIPAAGGAVLGAIAGGKKGAAIGAAAGAGAGTALVLATPGEEVRLPRGTMLRVTLSGPLTLPAPRPRF